MDTTDQHAAKSTSILMRFVFMQHGDAHQALTDCPGSPQHIAAARASRRSNQESGRDKFIPGCGDEADIDQWAAMGMQWAVVAASDCCVTSNHDEVHVMAALTPQQESWLRDHLLLDDTDADAGTGDTMWTIDGGSWRDERGATPYIAVQVDIH